MVSVIIICRGSLKNSDGNYYLRANGPATPISTFQLGDHVQNGGKSEYLQRNIGNTMETRAYVYSASEHLYWMSLWHLEFRLAVLLHENSKAIREVLVAVTITAEGGERRERE